ncbi:MAG: dioxygenase [Hyphomicrobiales bacterium]|nr:dioxygenase [Hyphomicrobiales bacterium]
MRFPTLFVSHGAPDMVLRANAARDFLAGYGERLGKPKTILAVSAHFASDRPTIAADSAPSMIYDFYGFPDELYEIDYPAPGDPVTAIKITALLQSAGYAAEMIHGRGYDHGVWTPLMLMYPEADVSIVQLSVQPGEGVAHHLAIGRALAALPQDGVLIVGSGALTHNLRAYFELSHMPDAETPFWVAAFAEWVAEAAAAGDAEAISDLYDQAPFARENHPTNEHFLPFLVALGAAGAGARGNRVHNSFDHGVLAMDTYAFA